MLRATNDAVGIEVVRMGEYVHLIGHFGPQDTSSVKMHAVALRKELGGHRGTIGSLGRKNGEVYIYYMPSLYPDYAFVSFPDSPQGGDLITVRRDSLRRKLRQLTI